MAIGKRIGDLLSSSSSRPKLLEPKQQQVQEPKQEQVQEHKESGQASGNIVFTPESPKYDMDDLILPQGVKDKLLDVVEYEHNSKVVFDDWGLGETHKYSKRIGINLYGPPGTGKTMAAHAIAKFLGRNILIINYADIESKYVGETPKNIRAAFVAAKESNSILFFDEADAILSRRVTDMQRAGDVSVNQTRSVMLMLMNDYDDFIIFATNFISNFDPAFMRRISMHIKFDLPDEECRKRLWQHYIPDKMPTDVNIEYLAEKFSGISGSDIANAVLNAAFKAARKKDFMVETEYIEEAVEQILASKKANEGENIKTTTREVSKEYVDAQLKERND